MIAAARKAAGKLKQGWVDVADEGQLASHVVLALL